MRRRDLLVLFGGTVGWPAAAPAQQPAPPLVRFLRSTPAAPFAGLVAAFRKGLSEAGLVEGQTVTVDYRWADNQLDRLPGLAADLVGREVAVIVGNGLAVRAAKAATSTIPVVFVLADDPVESGLVASLSRPGGNITGVTFFAGAALNLKRLELLHEVAPKGLPIAVLLDPNYPEGADMSGIEAAARALGRPAKVVTAAGPRELEEAFAAMIRAGAGAVLVSGSSFFTSQRQAIVALAARHALPAIYDLRDYVETGGLASYGASISEAYRQAGQYVGRILGGARPSEMPVLRSTAFEMAINLKTARALNLTIPPTLLARADEIIE
ncbi:MAG TPA: ABC transporter substrate-binding protein [Microvirga sp.]|jgi:putative ABC transport system substrate-binding protein|nr:ABC transporter substrate-binding protein [Microvirga sp.]